VSWRNLSDYYPPPERERWSWVQYEAYIQTLGKELQKYKEGFEKLSSKYRELQPVTDQLINALKKERDHYKAEAVRLSELCSSKNHYVSHVQTTAANIAAQQPGSLSVENESAEEILLKLLNQPSPVGKRS
jgi:hypothetical protein